MEKGGEYYDFGPEINAQLDEELNKELPNIAESTAKSGHDLGSGLSHVLITVGRLAHSVGHTNKCLSAITRRLDNMETALLGQKEYNNKGFSDRIADIENELVEARKRDIESAKLVREVKEAHSQLKFRFGVIGGSLLTASGIAQWFVNIWTKAKG